MAGWDSQALVPVLPHKGILDAFFIPFRCVLHTWSVSVALGEKHESAAAQSRKGGPGGTGVSGSVSRSPTHKTLLPFDFPVLEPMRAHMRHCPVITKHICKH